MRLISGIFILFALYFGWLASEITVHFYDGFQYLNSAKALAGFSSYYDYTRPPVFQFLLTPIMLAYRATGSTFWLERAPFFFMLLLNGAAIWVVWRLLREGLEKEVALATIGLFLINRAIFHYIPFVMPDLIAMGFVAAMAINCHRLVQSGKQKDAVLAGLWLGLAVSTKHYLAPLCLAPPIFLLLEWFSRDEGRIKFRPQLKQFGWLVLMGLCCASTFLLLHKVAFLIIPEYRKHSLFALFGYIVQSGSAINGLAQVESFSASIRLTAGLIYSSLSIPLMLVVIVGFILAIYSNDRLGRLLAIIAAIHLILMTTIIVNREARYFLQIYPAFYYFIGVAIKRGKSLWSEWGMANRRARFITAGIAIIILASVLRGTAVEARSFTDESYRNDLLIRLGHYVKEHTGAQNKSIWIGEWASISPKSPTLEEEPFLRKDYYYFFQANGNAISYYSDRLGYTFYPHTPVQGEIGPLLAGDLIIQIPAETEPKPISIHNFDRFWQFEQAEVDPGGGDGALFIDQPSNARLTVVKTGEGFAFQGQGAPYLLWEISLNKKVNIFMNAMPLPQLPWLVRSSAPIAAKDIQELKMIRLGPPQSLFSF